jgi:alkaline phosphatase
MRIKSPSNRSRVLFVLTIASFIFILSCAGHDDTIQTGNVIFIHPDGSGAAMWAGLRVFKYGPDSSSNWDRMDRMGLYRSHVLNSTNSSSHAGATIHSRGVKVEFNTYGSCPEKPVIALSGKNKSIMQEAMDAGMATALINSGHICEPGTGAFVAGVPRRSMTDEISEQIINSGVDIILSGGERLLLPEGEVGRHGRPGIRKDGKNLISQARENGYKVVYNRDELLELTPKVDKVLGVFAANHTFNDYGEERLKNENLPFYDPQAPTVAEMAEVALKILTAKGMPFLMVVEEEGTDNFGNANNAGGTLEALARADAAIGAAMNYIKEHPQTLLITAADSDAGGFQLWPVIDPDDFDKPLPLIVRNGAPLDGVNGAGTLPFEAAPDKHGNRLRFGVAWSCNDDVAGSVLARAHGLNSDLLEVNVDNTDIYRIMYATLFGKLLPPYNQLD